MFPTDPFLRAGLEFLLLMAESCTEILEVPGTFLDFLSDHLLFNSQQEALS